MLAVVEDEQQLPVLDELRQRFAHRTPRFFLDARAPTPPPAARAADRPAAQARRTTRRRDTRPSRPPPPAATAASCRGRPTPSSVSSRVVAEQRLDLGELALAADERGHLLRQVVGRRLQRAQRREFLPQLRMQDLIDALGAREVAQPHGAQIAQRHARRQAIADQRRPPPATPAPARRAPRS